jgi:hypothetical protein
VTAKTLSPEAQRWLGFFGLQTPDQVTFALQTRVIAIGKKPGLTGDIVRELREWSAPELEDALQSPLPDPPRITEILHYFQCFETAHRHREREEAQQCMMAARAAQSQTAAAREQA